LVVLLARDLVEDVADDGPRDGTHEPLLDLVHGLAHVLDQEPGLLGVDPPHDVDVDVDVVAVLGLESDVVRHGAVALGGVRGHDEVLLRDGQRVPGVQDGQEEVDAARLVGLLRAPLLEDAPEAGADPDLGRARGPAAGGGEGRPKQEDDRRAARHFFSPAGMATAPLPGFTPIRTQALRTKAMYCSGVITAPSMLSNILAVSSATT